MANVTKIIANNKTYFNKDQEARNSIEDILKNKQDNLTAETPLDLTDSKLSINLSNYYTKTENDNILKNKVEELNTKITNNKNFIDTIKSYLTKLLKLNSNFENNDEIPDVSQYASKTKQIDNTLDNLETSINNNYNTLNTKVDNYVEQNNTELEEIKTNINTNYSSLNQRMILIEREFFGDSYKEGQITFNNSLSRLDTLEDKINQIYDKLLEAGLVNTEDTEAINK